MSTFRRPSAQPQGLPDDGSSVIGPLIGMRRPRYEILHDVLDPFLQVLPQDEDLFIFVNLTSMLRSFFSEYNAAQLTRSEMNRYPRALASELMNIAGHYRNFAWKHHGIRTIVLLYHSSVPCDDKVAIDPAFKSSLYSKRVTEGAGNEFDAIRRYVNYNIKVAKELAVRIPNVHVVDTGDIDPEAWPWALAAEGRIEGSALVLSAWTSDLQYAVIPHNERILGREWAVLNPSKENTKLYTRDNVILAAIKDSKKKDDIAPMLDPSHILYMLALAGYSDLGVTGLPKVGIVKAAQMIATLVTKGRLPATAPSLTALLEELELPEEHRQIVEKCWKLLTYDDYVHTIPPEKLATLDTQFVNLSGLGEIEKANATFFGGGLNLELLFAGENF